MALGGVFKGDFYIITENKKRIYLQPMLVPVKRKKVKFVEEEF